MRFPALILLAATALPAQAPTAAPRAVTLAATPAERRAAAAFAAALKLGPLPLHAFLVRMPKGADLHMHLSGAVYAETFLRMAAADNLCLDPVKLAITKADTACPTPATTVFRDQRLYDAMVDSLSMRAFVPTPNTNGHDQFFATFARMGPIDKSHLGEELDEIATRAATQNEQYLEIMDTPPFNRAAVPAWPTPLLPATTAATSTPDDLSGTTPAELAALRTRLLASPLQADIATDRQHYAAALAARNQIEHCGTPTALPACAVTIKFLYQVLRQNAPNLVFAQTLLAFEVASQDPDVVGLNYVQPEDAYLSMAEYHRQMLMLHYLHIVYPNVHISLHAGELAPAMVPPAGLHNHIRQALDLGHAERIGHGVDVMYEQDPQRLLHDLATRHVMVEINLTSNDVILGVSGNQHSFPDYRLAHVPVALSTDDEGVSRIDLTHEYVRAARDFGLTYLDLKQMARTSLEHAFLPGPSLWAHPDDFTQPVPACAHQPLGTASPTPACAAYLQASPRATQQDQLEHRFQTFESTL